MKSLLSLVTLLTAASAFTSPLDGNSRRTFGSTAAPPSFAPTKTSTNSQLAAGGALFDVPDGFFTLTFPMLGIMLQISLQINRARLEERAFDLRLKEARERKMELDPSLTESELIRQEAAQDVSYYGPDAIARRKQGNTEESSARGPQRVTVLERDGREEGRRYTLSDEEIDEIEAMGVEYDPYYDDPYTEEELPDDEDYRLDKRYGDRTYDNGEVFYKDADSGLFYRQGAKPRSKSFWAGSRN